MTLEISAHSDNLVEETELFKAVVHLEYALLSVTIVLMCWQTSLLQGSLFIKLRFENQF